MKKSSVFPAIVLAVFCSSSFGITVNDAEQSAADAFFAAHFATAADAAKIFGFVLDGQKSSDVLAGWKTTEAIQELSGGKTQKTFTYASANGDDVITLVAVKYDRFPATEWTVYVENRGSGKSGLFEAVRSWDGSFSSAVSDRPDFGFDLSRDFGAKDSTFTCATGWVANWNMHSSPVTAGDTRYFKTTKGTAYIGKTGSQSFMIEGNEVPAHRIFAACDEGFDGTVDNGSAPAVIWTAPRSATYEFHVRIKNIGRGGDGVSVMMHDWRWKPFEGGDIDDQKEGEWLVTRQVAAGDKIAVTMSSRGDRVGDLCLIDVQVKDLTNVRLPVLRTVNGSDARPDDFQPMVHDLGRDARYEFAPRSGRATDSEAMPFFNLQNEDGGYLVAIGWPGQWKASIHREADTSVRFESGFEDCRFKLQPGEKFRTALMVVMHYTGDWLRGQNIWRKWMMEENHPKRANGKPLEPFVAACSSHQYGEMIFANQECQKYFIDRYLEEDIQINYWWMDAGWYVNKDHKWTNTGTWITDAHRFPDGLRSVADHGHKKGVKSIVWFEPERVDPGTWLYEQGDWLLRKQKDGYPAKVAYQTNNKWGLLNLGKPEVLAWAKEHFNKFVDDNHIDLYRQDFNIHPLYYWRENDAPDRVGMTENLYCQGYLAFWDSLHEGRKGFLIDSCASGGRRNDIESMRRSVPLLRSDYLFEPIGQQAHTYGLSLWYPFYGTGTGNLHDYQNVYALRSNMAPSNTACYDMRNSDTDFSVLRKYFKEREIFTRYMTMDYYPLTRYSLDRDAWMAYQFCDTDAGHGIVMVFRRPENRESAKFIRLQALDPDGFYELEYTDIRFRDILLGSVLMERGLQVNLDGKLASAIHAPGTGKHEVSTKKDNSESEVIRFRKISPRK